MATKLTAKKIATLTTVLKKALDEARKAIEGMEDGGTCNLDNPVLCCSRPNPAIEAAIEAAGCRCWFTNSTWHRGYIISTHLGGQGNTRLTVAEKMSEVLNREGFTSSVWYQID